MSIYVRISNVISYAFYVRHFVRKPIIIQPNPKIIIFVKNRNINVKKFVNHLAFVKLIINKQNKFGKQS